jgi:hypothetical protein
MAKEPKKRGPKGPDQYPRKGNDLRDIGDLLLVVALLWLPRFGSINVDMLGALMWPRSSPTSQAVLARRKLHQLLSKDFIYAVLGGSGREFFVLTSKGAREVQRHHPGLYPRLRSGARLTSVSGATWQHRWLANAYLVTKAAQGCDISTEYEQLTDSPYWHFLWECVPFRGKKCDGLYCDTGSSLAEESVSGPLGLTVVEVLRSRVRCKRGLNEQHDPMFSLLQSLQQHTAHGVSVDLVVVDERQGHQILESVGREARKRGIWFDPCLVRAVYARVTPGACDIPVFRMNLWSSAALPQPPARPVLGIERKSRLPASDSSQVERISVPPRGTRSGPTDKIVEFRIVKDRINPEDQRREIEIRYQPSDLALKGHAGNRGHPDHMEIDGFDEDGNPLFLDAIDVPSDIDLADPVGRKQLFEKLRAMLAKAGLLVR